MAKKSDQPAKPKRENPFKRIASVYKTIKAIDPQVTLWMLLAFVVVLGVGTLIGLLVGHVILALIVAIPFALLAAMIVLSRRGERAAFAQMEGQRGASIGGLSALRRGWYYDQEPVAADATKPSEINTAAVVFRALGRPGIVLLGEGPKHRVDKLFVKETKKVSRVAPGVPVHTFIVGTGEGELPPRKIRMTLTKLRPALSKEEMSVVNKRLKSLPGIRQGVPAGVDPSRARMNRSALRGR
ncbi:DUF4191 domain-containing protein [Janibacter indicus]|uniref:DUF4191 domain-containing protein n=1 Tax=Janibacter indicus TaxID=857417 RepID=A0A1L3MFX9_9MICO|nr:DUF4191 domain-containing protein [Janibacter indicus]APH01218.1 hypothetical protein ASJ30_06390 [Janibacter indicus]QOK24030.1 DUF4191 domain-containing protein [Janibacter indicus]